MFGELGYGAHRVRDIVRRTDLAAGTFYNYFPDKESIFRALVEEIGDEARRRVRAARRSAASADDFIEDGYRAYFEFIVEDPVTRVPAPQRRAPSASASTTPCSRPGSGARGGPPRGDRRAATSRTPTSATSRT